MAVPVEQLLSKEYARNRVEATMSPTVPAQPPVQYVQPFHFDEVSVVDACSVCLCSAGDPNHPLVQAWAPMPEPPKRGTTHFSIIDVNRNMVAFTTTIEENLGSAVVRLLARVP